MFDFFKKKSKYDYKSKNVSEIIISDYGHDILSFTIMGVCPIDKISARNEFCTHISAAAICGDEIAVALSCFIDQSDVSGGSLPISVDRMSKNSFAHLVNILEMYIPQQISESAKKFLKLNKHSVSVLAKSGNLPAMWIMGSWYSYDEFERKGAEYCFKEKLKWFEKCAHLGYSKPMGELGLMYDTKNNESAAFMPRNIKRAAYWFRKAALNGDPRSAFNLAGLYAQGEFVSQSIEVAQLWLSVAFHNSTTDEQRNLYLSVSDQTGIPILETPDIGVDLELNEDTSEFQDAY